MAVTEIFLDVVNASLAAIRQTGCTSRRICSLGYPDILVSAERLRAIVGERVAAQVRYRADSAEILRWHGAQARTGDVPHAESLFAALGYDLEVVDIVEARGGEILLDLNEPLPEEMKQRYAIVMDAGTLEHCFNIGQAAANVAEMVAAGGAAVHGNPINMFNHGFYNLNPTWYYDFYESNGYVIELLQLVVPGEVPTVSPVPPFARFQRVPENSTLLVVARRAETKAIRWPVQRKYRANAGLRG